MNVNKAHVRKCLLFSYLNAVYRYAYMGTRGG